MKKKAPQGRGGAGARSRPKVAATKASPKRNVLSRTRTAGNEEAGDDRLKAQPDRAQADFVHTGKSDDDKAGQGRMRPRKPEKASLPIVGIGASAGGLEALEQFLKHVPERCGMAFVIVMHLDPSQKATVVEILQRTTRLPVVQVKDGQKVQPDCVYVIPPGKNMAILNGVLHLFPQPLARGMHHGFHQFHAAVEVLLGELHDEDGVLAG